MTKSEVRMYLKIKNKENKTELEELYLTLREYNDICCNIDISYQKLKYDYNIYKNKRKNNYNKFIDEETLNLMVEIKYLFKLAMSNSKWDSDNLTFEEVLYINYEMAIENIKKDMKLIGEYNV